MNALFLTQASSLDLFFPLMQALREPLDLRRAGFYVADSRFYREFVKHHPELEAGDLLVLKEWEIMARAATGNADMPRLARYETALGNPNLWGALVADRRLYTGARSAYRQHDRPRYSHARLLRILEEGLIAMERLFDELRPDVVMSFICVTFGEYLAYLVARSRGIRFLDLRPTRIRSYATWGESIFEPSERIEAAYREYRASGTRDAHTAAAEAYLKSLRTDAVRYEGATPATRAPVVSTGGADGWPATLARLARDTYDYHLGGLKQDPHVADPALGLLYSRLLNPLRARGVNRRLDEAYLQKQDLARRRFVFFPLHKEPEVTLLVYSKEYLNQVELARVLGHSVPVDVEIVVKEHPAMVGKRPWQYYQKLLEVPNVRLADPGIASRDLVESASLVATVCGSIGLEALLRGKPVLSFGGTPYAYLPKSMHRRAGPLHELGNDVADLLKSYEYDEWALVSYVAATMRESVEVGLYSNLLGRQGGFKFGNADRQQDIQTLARHTVGVVAGSMA